MCDLRKVRDGVICERERLEEGELLVDLRVDAGDMVVRRSDVLQPLEQRKITEVADIICLLYTSDAADE